MADMDVDPPAAGRKDDGKDKKRFEVKKVRTRTVLHLIGLSLIVERRCAVGLG